MAEGAARAGSLLVVAVNATTSIEDIAAAQPTLPLWFQLYNWDDRDALAGVIGRAEAAGAKAIVPLVNTPIGVNHTSPKIGFRLPAGAKFAHFESSPGLEAANTWDYITWLRSVTSLPIVPKGIMTRDDAARAVDAGAAGIIVSNHGGRQLARSISTLDALPDVVAGAGGAEVYLDGGVRSGGDVLIALALGARAVLVARPGAVGHGAGRRRRRGARPRRPARGARGGRRDVRHRRHRVRPARSRRRRRGLRSRRRARWDDAMTAGHRRGPHDRARRDVRRQPHPEPADGAIDRAVEHPRLRAGQADRQRRPQRLGGDLPRARHPGDPRGGRAGRHRPVGDSGPRAGAGTSRGQPSTRTPPRR